LHVKVFFSIANTKTSLKKAIKELVRLKGPSFLRVKINRLPTTNIPRVSKKYTSEQIATQFRKSITQKN